MALLTINGVALPTPSEYSIGVMDLSKAERNANGFLIIERIATKKKITLKYSYLSANDLKTILTAITPTFYDLTYLDPVTNVFVTASFYCGDRDVGMVDFQNGVARYRDLAFDFIER